MFGTAPKECDACSSMQMFLSLLNLFVTTSTLVSLQLGKAKKVVEQIRAADETNKETNQNLDVADKKVGVKCLSMDAVVDAKK